ncbi:uncharacterized protein LOC122029912 [Zingiber officinale]|uniref:Uncharacterized protein n=1 Tax=Zingiber officinale TaxID=94328 RepID=A0A8J5IAE0_ZINOF|nr:uncharacterized protein LOC122029912 [Zingiber officinale]KAG6531481.1 hypothetical protein ZIOFF_005295 [Zingiber officinale]
MEVTEIDMRSSGVEAAAGKKPTSLSRLQNQAPASPLQINTNKVKESLTWEEDDAAPIPLLSPLVVSPSPLMWDGDDDDDDAMEEDEASEANMEATSSPQGWRHPALPVPVLEPASLVPFFEFQCFFAQY